MHVCWGVGRGGEASGDGNSKERFRKKVVELKHENHMRIIWRRRGKDLIQRGNIMSKGTEVG